MQASRPLRKCDLTPSHLNGAKVHTNHRKSTENHNQFSICFLPISVSIVSVVSSVFILHMLSIVGVVVCLSLGTPLSGGKKCHIVTSLVSHRERREGSRCTE